MAYKMYGGIRCSPISVGQRKKKQNTTIKCDEIKIMTIINVNILNLHNSLFNNDNRYMKVTLKSELIRVAR